jgi:LysR family cyn operon transcriptional activator
MELRHIRYFIRAAELLHFTRAAESLFVSQPTLSMHIQQLEEELGTPLFDRVGRKVQLTEAGKVFLEHAERAVRELELAEEKIADLKGLASGTLQLGAILTFGQELLPTWIASFTANHPHIRMVVKTGDSDFIEENLLAGNIDLALSFVPPTSESLRGEILFTEEVFLVVGENHKFAQKSQIQVQDLKDLPLALVGRRWTARRIIDAFMAENEIVPNVLIEMDDLHGLLRVASEGVAGALLSRLVVSTYPNLRLIPFAEKKIYMQYGMLWHEQKHLSPSTKAFLEHVRLKCAEN